MRLLNIKNDFDVIEMEDLKEENIWGNIIVALHPTWMERKAQVLKDGRLGTYLCRVHTGILYKAEQGLDTVLVKKEKKLAGISVL